MFPASAQGLERGAEDDSLEGRARRSTQCSIRSTQYRARIHHRAYPPNKELVGGEDHVDVICCFQWPHVEGGGSILSGIISLFSGCCGNGGWHIREDTLRNPMHQELVNVVPIPTNVRMGSAKAGP